MVDQIKADTSALQTADSMVTSQFEGLVQDRLMELQQDPSDLSEGSEVAQSMIPGISDSQMAELESKVLNKLLSHLQQSGARNVDLMESRWASAGAAFRTGTRTRQPTWV
jgi:hypothetical protein